MGTRSITIPRTHAVNEVQQCFLRLRYRMVLPDNNPPGIRVKIAFLIANNRFNAITIFHKYYEYIL